MKKKTVFLSLVAMLGFCICVYIFIQEQARAKHSLLADQKSKQLRKNIQKEIESLEDHEWAGEYYHGDGLGVNVSLLIAPKAGYLFEWKGCLGLYDRNYGDVTVNDGTIHLSFSFPNKQEGFQGIAESFIPVSWDQRKYLIPEQEMIRFCNSINSGYEPRNYIHGRHLLKVGDEEKPVSGKPDVPEKYNKYLLKQPITAEIISVGKTAMRLGCADIKFYDTFVTLNIGTKSGLLPGMELYVIEPKHLVESVIIDNVDSNQSTGTITQTDSKDSPETDWKLSTVPSWNKQKQNVIEQMKEQEK